MVALDTIVVRNSRILGADVGGETVLMSSEQGNYYALTATSRAIWERLETPVRVSDLCAELAATYQMPLETVEIDTLDFLDYLETQNMIESQNAPEAPADSGPAPQD
ncbi:MAG: PqqD family peptide modification chaperone [Brevundimonas sp.]|uniref:PqqD family peptide modification chaperone n=1 Tax=Brevundimonas sp. TaxID=1871086 RepID=UPI002736DFD9|nr:PqqD family peptide modification chaperone [Brevundimonas sp.]MDP3377246.1 PqqD family peptide modification chaperone [Brevundimonas sp.]